jgi:hypothetical protein
LLKCIYRQRSSEDETAVIGELGEAIAAVDVFADVWAIRVRLQLERATSLCSISPSIASS